MKVVVIGNGFDLYHKLPTSYIDFKNFLQKHHPNVYSAMNEIIRRGFENTKLADSTLFDEDVEWNRIELYFMSYIFETNEHRKIYPNFNVYFKEFLNEYAVKKISKYKELGIFSPEMKESIEDADLFINYNYTNTIKLYDVDYKRVYYKHNAIHLNPLLPLITGHDNDVETINRLIINKKNLGSTNMRKYTNNHRKSTLNELHTDIKDTQDAASMYDCLFQSEIFLEELIIVGHSLESCDSNSLTKLFKKINEKTVIRVFLHEDNVTKLNTLKKRLKTLNASIDVENLNIWKKYWDIDFSKYEKYMNDNEGLTNGE